MRTHFSKSAELWGQNGAAVQCYSKSDALENTEPVTRRALSVIARFGKLEAGLAGQSLPVVQ